MQENLYYKAVFQRRNAIKDFLMNVFLTFCSWPRLVLEVFARKNMGERYFSLFTCIIIALFLIYFPYYVELASQRGYYSPSFWQMVKSHPLFYLFIVSFVIMSFVRWREVKRLPSVFDFSRFSLSTGTVNPIFYKIKIYDKSFDIRTIETIIEPLCFFIIGYILSFIDSVLGATIADCAIIYSISYFAAYRSGDHMIMDTIDEMICNEEMVSSFVDGRQPDETRGFNAYGRKPTDPDMRRRVVGQFMQQDEFSDVS